MLRLRLRVVLLLLAVTVNAASAQLVSLPLPGAAAPTPAYNASNQLVIESHAVPAGYMELFPAFDGVYRHPVIVVEGFDPQNTTFPGKVYGQMNALGGIDMARAAGCNVWIVNFGDGGGSMAANASLVSSAIVQAANYGGLSNAPVDVVGLSMGGVITRWALAADEQNNGPSDGLVRLFVSGDSPQQGANANPCFQELVLFQGDASSLPIVRSDASVALMYQNVRSYSNNGCAAGALPSRTNYVSASAVHDWFYNAINALNGDGYPNKSRNVGVSNGSTSPLPYPAGAWLMKCRTYANFIFRINVCSETYYASAADVGPGSLAGDFAPGQIRRPEFELDQNFTPTFIPLASALDMRGGQTMFDRTLVQTSPQNHSAMTQATHEFMLEEILGAGAKINPKMAPDGATVNLSGLVVTGVYADRFYAQQADRAWGVAVQSPASVLPGDVISVVGSITSIGQERVVMASSVSVQRHQDEPVPLDLASGAAGGSAMGLYTAGTAGAAGLSNVGLLVRVSGKVAVGGSGYFVVDDGSGPVRVITGGLSGGGGLQPPAAGTFVRVTGASSTVADGEMLVSAVRPRSAADVTVP